MREYGLIAILLSLIACGGSGNKASSSSPISSGNAPDQITSNNLTIPNNTLVDTYQVLLIGNSHVSSNDLPGIIQLLIEQGLANKQAHVERASGIAYLDDRQNDGVTLEKLNSHPWTHVILQAQKYSQSGAILYPTDAAEYWIDLVKQKGATPILFPEHPQRGNETEGRYVHDIHLSIIEKQKSCIAPIGLGWDKVLEEMPELALHAPDGNHAAFTGSFFTALVFYQVITGELADSLPVIESLHIEAQVQQRLGAIASQILDEHQACDY